MTFLFLGNRSMMATVSLFPAINFSSQHEDVGSLFLRWSHFRQVQIFTAVFFPPCAGHNAQTNSIPHCFLSFLCRSHFRQIQSFASICFPPCAGHISDKSGASLPPFTLALAAFQTDPTLHCSLSSLCWPHFGLERKREAFNSAGCLLLCRSMAGLPAFI